jgi:hypothetical protein
MTPRFTILLVLGALLAASPTAMAIEKPSYRVVERRGDFELREYAPYLVAETVVGGSREEAGNAGFRILAGYIFGKNRGEKKIAMTAPVTQAEPAKIAMTAPVTQAGQEGRWIIQFMMPSAFTLETLPEPLDPAISFRVVPARRVAAHTYSGTWSASRYDEHLATLRAALASAGLTAVGEPTWARYDPPFMPWFLRTNEILVELAPGGPEAEGPPLRQSPR